MASPQDRTEQATPKRREQARKKGQVAKGHDLVSAVGLIVGAYAFRLGLPMARSSLLVFIGRTMGSLGNADVTSSDAANLLWEGAAVALTGAAPVVLAVMASGIVMNVAQVGLMVTPDAIAPQIKRIDPLSGLGRIFSKQALVELAKAAAKSVVAGYFGYTAMWSRLPALMATSAMSLPAGVTAAAEAAAYVVQQMAMPLLLIAAADYALRRYQFEQELKMTKQEVKEELREQEGDQQIRARQRQLQRQLATARMMEDVKTADVVITNPTHYAVAIRYDGAAMRAPIVVAKGQRLIALRIREVAVEAGVPVVENPPVAQALFRMARVGSEIPPDLYRAVAEVLAFVYKAGNRGR